MLASHPLPRGDTAILQLCTASHIENVKHLQILPLDLRQNSPKFATVKPRVATHYIDDITGHAHTIIGAQVNQPRSTQLHTLRFPVPPLPLKHCLGARLWKQTNRVVVQLVQQYGLISLGAMYGTWPRVLRIRAVYMYNIIVHVYGPDA